MTEQELGQLMEKQTISIIIPTLNEEARIASLIDYLHELSQSEYLQEIIVCDGGSTDKTQGIAEAAGVVLLHSPRCGRATQMNYAADHAAGDILYFVHADVFPPKECLINIIDALAEGHTMGCFSYDFASQSKLLKINAYFTQFDLMTSGGGDQTFFIPKAIFNELGQFNEKLPIMEDFDFVWRAKKHYPLHLVKNRATVSARKYERNSYLKVQVVNGVTLALFKRGHCPFKLARWYKRLLN